MLFRSDFALTFLALSLLLGLVLSLGALVLEQSLLAFYARPRDAVWLITAALLENLGYRQAILWYRVRGLWKYLRGNKSWGRMVRAGFAAR